VKLVSCKWLAVRIYILHVANCKIDLVDSTGTQVFPLSQKLHNHLAESSGLIDSTQDSTQANMPVGYCRNRILQQGEPTANV